MGSLTWLLLALAGVVALADWVAVAFGNKRLEYVCKPGLMVVLIAVAATIHASSPAQQRWWLAALALGLCGDVFLMLPADRFVAGLTAFLLGHIAYIAGFFAAGVPLLTALLWLGALLLVVSVALPPVLAGVLAAKKRAMVAPIIVYAFVIALMAASALARRSQAAEAGAILFMTSDGLIAYRRFVTRRGWMPLAIIVTYHLGQAALVVSLAR